MAVDLGNLSIGVVPQLAALDALELRLAALDRGQYAAHIGVDTTAVAAAEQRVTSLGAAHQQLGARPVALGMDVSQVEQARTSVKNLDNDLLSLVGTSSKVAAAFAAPVAAGALTKFASDYQQILVTTSNQTTLTTADIATMDKAIRELPTGAASLQSVATAFKNVSDLGYSAADATKILNETSKAATETGADQATVALAITSAMKEYNATADEAGKYTNIVAQAAKEANSSLQAWTEGTRTGVAVAAAYGVSLQEADAFMVALTRHGFDAAEASTQLRGVIQHIIHPDAAAQQALQEVTKATGIDLVSDFSDEGLKARGFANVMNDLQAVIAKTGDESIVTRLIPALRGGQGALITVTQAAGDAKVALTDLNAAADGSLKPVEDGFARISQTTGYQFSATMKQLKLDMIDLGQTFLPIADDIIQGFDKIPAGAIKAAADIALAFAAIKTATAIGGLIDTGIGAVTAALAANTAATVANGVAVETEAAALTTETVALDTQTASLDANVASRKAFTAAGIAGEIALAAGLAYAMQQLDQWWVQHSPFGTGAQQPDAQYQQRLAATGQSAQYQLEEEQARLAAMQQQNAQGNINIPHVGSLLPSGLSIPGWVPGIGGKSLGGGYSDTEIAAQQDYITYLQRQAAIEASARPAGPPVPPGYSAATAGGGRGLPSAQEQKQLDANARDFAKSQADYFKQLDKDVADAKAKAQKDAADQAKADLQAQGDYAVALATKVSDAWKSAGTAVASVDPSKGIQGLIDAAPQLDKVRDALAAMGQSDGALNRLSALADVFQSWSADTDKANAALRGYDLTLTETTKAIQGIGSLKSEYIAALDAAEKRQAAGTADASDLAIIGARSTALNQLDQQTSRLQQQGNLDILGKLQNLPDFAQLNQNLRNVVTAQGGGAAVLASLTADKARASADITQFQQTWHDSIEKIKQDTADAKKAVDAFLVGLPTDKTITIHYAQDAPGSASTAQGNDGTGYAAQAGGGSLGYSPLAYEQYQQIVTSGPLANNPQDYAGIMAAAQRYGVDPRALLAFINGENVAPALAAVNNFGGIKGQGGPPAPANEGGTYAAYSSPQAFFEALAANLTTGAYAQDYASGNLAAIRQRYVAGSATPTPEQQANIANTVAAYQRYQSQYPASSDPTRGYGSGGVLPGYGPGDVGLGSGQFPTGGALNGTQGISSSAIVDEARKHLNEATQIDGEPWYMWCEKFVDNQLQTVLGSTYRPVSADQRVRDARAGVAGAGTIIAQSMARAGDLVAWSGDSAYAGSPQGHVGIYEGNNNYIGTTRTGIQERPIGPDAVFIRPDGVVAAGPEPGSTVYSGASSRVATGYGPGTYTSTGGTSAPVSSSINAAAAASPREGGGQTAGGAGTPHDLQQATVSAGQLQTALQAVNAEFAKMDAPSIKASRDSLASILPVLTEIAGKALFGPNGPLTSTEKQEAAAAAWQKGLNYEKDFAVVVQGIENHTISLDAATQMLAADIGGPMADAYAKAAVASAQMAAATSETTRLTKEHDAVVKQRAADDQAASRAQTMAGWAQQDAAAAMQRRQQAAQDAIADRTTVENARYTGVQRGEQDRSRALQFSQQIQGTDLQNALVDLQQRQQNQVYNRTAQEQAVEGGVKIAGTREQAAALAASLGAMHERDLKQKDADTKAIDDIQARIRLQQRQAALDSYNLETETIREQRKHEDIMAGLAAQSVAQQRTFAREQQAEQEHQQAIQRSTQLQQWQEQDQRQAEDAAYQTAIDAQAKIKEDAQASLDAAQLAVQVWQQTGQVISGAASGVASQVSSLLNAQSLAQFPTTGAIRRLGGFATGGFAPIGSEFYVGDGPGGVVTANTEKVTLTSAGAMVTPLATRPAAQGGAPTVNLNLGDVSLMLSEQDKDEIKAFVQGKIDKARTSGRAYGKSIGRG
jgi:hypothetical protein